MRKTVLALVAVAFAALAIGCATQPGTAGQAKAIPTPAQLAAQVCPSAQAVLGVLSVPGAVDPKVAVDLAVATPIINTVCAAGATVQVTDVHSLATSGLPALLRVVQVAPIPDKDKQAAVLAVAVAQAAIAPIISANPSTAAATPTSAAAPAQ